MSQVPCNLCLPRHVSSVCTFMSQFCLPDFHPAGCAKFLTAGSCFCIHHRYLSVGYDLIFKKGLLGEYLEYRLGEDREGYGCMLDQKSSNEKWNEMGREQWEFSHQSWVLLGQQPLWYV